MEFPPCKICRKVHGTAEENRSLCGQCGILLQIKFWKRRNTLCISRLSKCRDGSKDRLLPANRIWEVTKKIGCGTKNGAAAVFLRQFTPVDAQGWEKSRFVGLLTHALRRRSFRASFRLPGGLPSDRLSPKKGHISTYSGGTVRDSHPVILFSGSGHTPLPPRSGIQLSTAL